jgi:phosphoribosylformimino-5-aminoimidazole carboxamide ribotide isomerase
MPFDVIPAIDVAGGKLCRMAIGGPAPAPEFGGDPVAAAESFLAAGARWLHVVDVDLAFTGEARNLEVVRAIAALGTPIQASGGLASEAEINGVLDAGASRAILGSSALADSRLAVRLISDLRERLVVGVETEGGRIRPRGRHRELDLDLDETAAWLADSGAARLLHTNVRRVGELSGPDLAGLRRVLRAGLPVVAAGGIATQEDLRSVALAGAEAAVVGRAALEARLDLGAAIASLA